MTRITAFLALAFLSVFYSQSLAGAPVHSWSKAFGGLGYETAQCVAADAAGNVYLTGALEGTTVGFGGAALTPIGGSDVYLAKFDAMGQHLWSKRLGGVLNDGVMSLATDAAGNVYVAGTFTGTVDLGDGNVVGPGGTDIFLVKFSSSGVFQWKRAGGSTGDDAPRSITLDTSGNIYLAGLFVNSMDLGGGVLTSAGSNDMYLMKYTSSGAFVWQKRFGDAGYQTVFSVATDLMDNVCLLGAFQGTINFGAGNMTSVGNANLALAKFNGGGVCQWSKRFGVGSLLDSGFIVTDSSANIYIAGNYLCCVDFGGGYVFENGGFYDIYLAKFDPSGMHIWSKDYGDNDWDLVNGIAIDTSDNLYLYGLFAGAINFGGGPLTTPAGALTPFLAEIDSFGAHIWSRKFQASTYYVSNVSVKATGIYFGVSGANVDFGGGLLPFVRSTDAYLARFSELPILPGISSVTDAPGDQGRQVSINFSRSGYDLAGNAAISSYQLFRKRDVFEKTSTSAAPGEIALSGWVQVGTVSPTGQEQYSTGAATLVDSTIVQGQHYSKFFVRATTSNPLVYLDSPPDSGYSVDNLAPPAPTGLAFFNGSLSWDASAASDFDYFIVYGSNTTSFGSGTFVDYTTDTSMDVTASPYAYYFVTTTDFSGNEGQPASLTAPTGVGATPTHFVLSISAYPNPFNPQTMIRYTVPAGGRVTVDVFDVHGAHVATLFDGVRPAGAFTHEWKGEDGAGHRLSSGVYFARVTQAAQARTYKLVMLK